MGIMMYAEFLLVLFFLATLILHHKSFQPPPLPRSGRRRNRRNRRGWGWVSKWWDEENWLGHWDTYDANRE